MTQSILVTRKNQVATITLNRPEKRNALNGEMIRDMFRALQLLAEDKHIRLLCIKSEGKDFCAGADLEWMQQMALASSDDNYKDAQSLADLLFSLYHFPKPTIVIVQGAVRGGGLGLIAACDIAIAAENSTFAFSEVKIGLTPSTISPYVIAAIGERSTRYYFLTAEVFHAEQARMLNLIHHVVKQDELQNLTQQMIHQLLANSPNALSAAKQLIYRVGHEKITENLAQLTAEHLTDIRQTQEAKSGFKAFLEKREINWSECE